MLSYWEQQSFTAYDFIVVGSGITGLSTAANLRKKHPHARILVLERGLLPSGASTRNAGFACFGSVTELLNDVEALGEAGMVDLVRLRWEGLQQLRQRLGDAAIGYAAYGGYELIREQEAYALDEVERLNTLLMPVFGKPVFHIQPNKVYAFGFNARKIQSIIWNAFEGQLHTGKMMHALLAHVLASGTEVWTGARVTALENHGYGAQVIVDSPTHGGNIALKAGQVAICTNAFTKALLPNEAIDLKPGRGLVLATKPIEGLPVKGTFHLEAGYYYFRNHGQRLIIGGGRNLDYAGETTTAFGVNTRILEQLKQLLNEVVLPKQPYEIEQHWSGIMAFGKEKSPIVRRLNPHMAMGVRLGGMGVAIGSMVGQQLAGIMSP